MSTETAQGCKLGKIEHYGKSVKDLMQEGVFPEGMATLSELRKAYADISTGMREDVHGNFEHGEWMADLVLTDGAKEKPNGILVFKYVQRSEDVVATESFKTGKSGYQPVGGKVIAYECPPDGWAIPADGKLWHPETGAAIATLPDKAKAVRENAKYIEQHPGEFAGWKIPERWHDEFRELFKKNFNPESPTPEQLAELETSYQWRPAANSGVTAVRRDFWDRECGPFRVSLRSEPEYRRSFFGARSRSKE